MYTSFFEKLTETVLSNVNYSCNDLRLSLRSRKVLLVAPKVI